MKTKHTIGPLVISPMNDGTTRISSEGHAELIPPDRDALVRVLNSHADLLAACRAALDALTMAKRDATGTRAYRMIDAAITKATMGE